VRGSHDARAMRPAVQKIESRRRLAEVMPGDDENAIWKLRAVSIHPHLPAFILFSLFPLLSIRGRFSRGKRIYIALYWLARHREWLSTACPVRETSLLLASKRERERERYSCRISLLSCRDAGTADLLSKPWALSVV
jgi:hypothetical protein